MRVTIAAVGRLKDAEGALCERYVKRFDAAGRAIGLGPLTVIEIGESRAGSAEVRRSEEALRLLKGADAATATVALDETGRPLTSAAFAALLAKYRDNGAKMVAFLVGGADGHGDAALDAARLRLSLSALTLPHGLARVVLAEQLYRAATILAGHPYHRA